MLLFDIIRKVRVARIVLPVILSVLSSAVPAEEWNARHEIRVTQLRTEYKFNPLGIDALHPRFSWQLQSPARGVQQAAYQIRVAETAHRLSDGTRLIFDSGKVVSAQSTQVHYTGQPMRSRQRYYWQVRVWDTQGRTSKWSEPAWWEMGLLSMDDWTAQWIEPQLEEDPNRSNPAPMLRAEFELGEKIAHARAYITSLGLYELHLNAERVGDQLFTPGWTSYHHRLQYQTYDVTALLKSGRNAVGVVLGDGWFRGRLYPVGLHGSYGDRVRLLMQIEVTYADGRVQRIVSDDSWKAATGPVLLSDLYDGEVYDARLEREGWASPGYDDKDWNGVKGGAAPKAALIAPEAPPVRRIEELTPQRIFKTRAGLTVVDMGQNMVGWVRLRVRGAAGTKVTLRHAELIDRDGTLYGNLRTARQEVQYTLRGRGDETFEPHFTFQGFRYVAIDGYPGEIKPGSVTGIVIHSDMARTGAFETSNPQINQLYRNIVWTQKGNFLDVPTDCPQRAERMGWAGDGQVFSSTALLNMDVASFYTKWLGDLAADQRADGMVSMATPNTFDSPNAVKARRENPKDWDVIEGRAGYGDAITIVPWNVYLAHADVDLLKSQYPSMVRWVEYQRGRAGADHIWSGDWQFGDWLNLTPEQDPTIENSPALDLFATAHYARSVDLVRRAAKVLGEAADEAKYGLLLADIRKAFQAAFVADDGRVGAGTQTSYVLALDFDLLTEALRPLAARRLAEDVRARGHLTTGIFGTARLLSVLSRFGYLDEAYGLLNRKDYPSWLHPVNHGATTIWERWNGIGADGSLFPIAASNSFNHYAFGAVGEWMYRVMAGLNVDPDAPGYKHSLIEPRPGGGFTHVKAGLDTLYGRLASEWTLHDGRFSLNVEIPPNTRATVRLPHARIADVTEGGRQLKNAKDIKHLRQEDDSVLAEVGSGRYQFGYRWDGNAN